MLGFSLGCEISYASAVVYADDLDLSNSGAFNPIGISCRICERVKCTSRAVPPLKRKLVVDHRVRNPMPYEIEKGYVWDWGDLSRREGNIVVRIRPIAVVPNES